MSGVGRGSSELPTELYFSLSSLCANPRSHCRQQQKLLKVLQSIESDSAYLSQLASPAEEPLRDLEVRAMTSRLSKCIVRPP